MWSITSVTVLLVLVSGSYGESSYHKDLNNKKLQKVIEQKLETILDKFMIHVDERLDQVEETFSNTTAEIQKKNTCLYQTAIACEQKELNIECEAGNVINLIRANYGRLSIETCNSYGDTNTNCKSSTTIKKLANRCSGKNRCNVAASNHIFGDPCPGIIKYLEVHYTCEPPNLRENVESINMTVETMMQIHANNSQQYDLNLKEVDFRTVYGIAVGTSSYSDADAPTGAFQGVDVYWHSGVPTLPQAVWFHFSQPIKVVIYSFKSRDADATHLSDDGPSKYEFFGSNATDCSDQSSWVVLKQDNSGTPFTPKYDFRTEYVTHPDFYSCYGFKIIEVPGRSDGKKWAVINNVHFLH